jgi:hypothetical protein
MPVEQLGQQLAGSIISEEAYLFKKRIYPVWKIEDFPFFHKPKVDPKRQIAFFLVLCQVCDGGTMKHS